MTAVDTNVIVRYLVADDPGQSEAARSLLEQLTPRQSRLHMPRGGDQSCLGAGAQLPVPSCTDCRGADGPDSFG